LYSEQPIRPSSNKTMGGDGRREETGDGRRRETGGDGRREETGAHIYSEL